MAHAFVAYRPEIVRTSCSPVRLSVVTSFHEWVDSCRQNLNFLLNFLNKFQFKMVKEIKHKQQVVRSLGLSLPKNSASPTVAHCKHPHPSRNYKKQFAFWRETLEFAAAIGRAVWHRFIIILWQEETFVFVSAPSLPIWQTRQVLRESRKSKRNTSK